MTVRGGLELSVVRCMDASRSQPFPSRVSHVNALEQKCRTRTTPIPWRPAIYLTVRSMARLALPSQKFPGLGLPKHACGPGIGQRFRPDSYAGLMGLRNMSNKEAVRPKARWIFVVMGWAWAEILYPMVGPGLGLSFFASGFVRSSPKPCPDRAMPRYTLLRMEGLKLMFANRDAND
jgi:hypothetical protein